MATEYIKREDAMDAWYTNERYTDLEGIPNADVVERKRGKWIYGGIAFCSVCKANKGGKLTDFCPNCGADMRGEA